MAFNLDILSPLYSFLTAFIITYISIPSIITVALTKHLYDEPNHRTSHTSNVPTLGGMAIFSGLLLASLLWVDRSQCPNLQYIMASLLVVFFIGLKDDILIIAPLTKLYGQIFAALIIVVLGNLHFTNLHGFYQITEIPDWLGMGLSIFVILVITNAFNLIDGIDGLSSGLGILISSTFGIWFYLAGFLQQSIISFALSGALLAFFRFNVFSKTKKYLWAIPARLFLGL